MNTVLCHRLKRLAFAAAVCALGTAALGQKDVDPRGPSKIVNPAKRGDKPVFAPRGGVCTAFDPATECQSTSLSIAYNITTFATADAISARDPVSSVCLQGFYFNNIPVQDHWVVTIYNDGGGVPGTVRETFTQGVDLVVNGPVATGVDFVGFAVQEWNLVLARPVDHAGECLWYELRNHASDLVFQLDGDDFQFAFNGNLYAAQDFDQDGVYELDGETLPDDLAICINGGFVNNRLCFNDPCAGIVPRNDHCENAFPLTVGLPNFNSTQCADSEANAVGVVTCSGRSINAGVWFSVTGTGNTMTVDLCRDPDFDNALEVYCGGCENLVCVAGNDDSCGLNATVSFCTFPGTEYLVLVHGVGGMRGDFTIGLSDSGEPCSAPPSCKACAGVTCPEGAIPEAESCEGGANDGCAGIVHLFEPIVGDGIVCGTLFSSGRGRDTDWYTVTAPESGTISAAVTAEFNGFASILDLGTPIDDTCETFGLKARATFVACLAAEMTATDLVPGNTYVVVIAPPATDLACSRYFLKVDQGAPAPPPAPCCNFNGDDSINSQDFFDFLAAFFANEPTADFNVDGIVNSQDFFDFIACFFAPPNPAC